MYRRLVKMQHFANTSQPYACISIDQVLHCLWSKKERTPVFVALSYKFKKECKWKTQTWHRGLFYYSPFFPLYVWSDPKMGWIKEFSPALSRRPTKRSRPRPEGGEGGMKIGLMIRSDCLLASAYTCILYCRVLTPYTGARDTSRICWCALRVRSTGGTYVKERLKLNLNVCEFFF